MDLELDGYPERGDGLADAEAVCYLLARRHMSVRPGTLRVWAFRGFIGTYGKDRFGRTLYNVWEVATHAENRRSGRKQTDPVTSEAALSVPKIGADA